MDAKLISFIVGYIIAINLISYIYILIDAKTSLIKISDKYKNLISVILSIIGGFVGILLGAEMLQYKQDSKIYKRWIPFMIFVEFCIIGFIIYERTSAV